MTTCLAFAQASSILPLRCYNLAQGTAISTALRSSSFTIPLRLRFIRPQSFVYDNDDGDNRSWGDDATDVSVSSLRQSTGLSLEPTRFGSRIRRLRLGLTLPRMSSSSSSSSEESPQQWTESERARLDSISKNFNTLGWLGLTFGIVRLVLVVFAIVQQGQPIPSDIFQILPNLIEIYIAKLLRDCGKAFADIAAAESYGQGELKPLLWRAFGNFDTILKKKIPPTTIKGLVSVASFFVILKTALGF